jgi:hypothetical protein
LHLFGIDRSAPPGGDVDLVDRHGDFLHHGGKRVGRTGLPCPTVPGAFDAMEAARRIAVRNSTEPTPGKSAFHRIRSALRPIADICRIVIGSATSDPNWTRPETHPSIQS